MRTPSVVFCGTKPGAAVALSMLVDRGWRVHQVVVPRDPQPAWIGGVSVEDVAARHDLPVVVQDDVSREPVDFVISYMYRELVRADLLELARRGALNFHAAPLPEYGGWAFYNVAILEGASEYGCTCHFMDEGFDTGPILEVRRFPIDASRETALSLERRAQGEMIRLFADFCDLAESGDQLPSTPQDPSRHRYLTRDEFERLKEVPPGADADTIDRYARAFWYPPYEGARVKVPGGTVELFPSVAKEETASALHASHWSALTAVARNRDHSEHSPQTVTVDMVGETVRLETSSETRTLPLASAEGFERVSDAWLRAGWDAKHVYSFTWLGRPIIQLPEDMFRIQEVIHRLRPDVIVETGVAHGGSLIFYATLCKALGKGHVVGVDVEIRANNRDAIEAHRLFEEITLVEGDSVAPATVARVRQHISDDDVVIVMLDSSHSKTHVLAELEAYAPLVSIDSYVVVADGIMEFVVGAPRTRPDWAWDNPRRAAEEFLAHHPEFVLDPPQFEFNEGLVKKPVTYWPDGWLRRAR